MKKNNEEYLKHTLPIFILGLVIGILCTYLAMDRINYLEKQLLENEIRAQYGDSDYSPEQNDGSFDISAFKEIEVDDIKNASKGKTIVVWIGMQGCGYCQAYAPNMELVAKEYGIKAHYIDANKVTQEDYNKIVSLDAIEGWENYGAGYTGTPFTMIIKDNKIVGGINGYRGEADIRTAFENAGLQR